MEDKEIMMRYADCIDNIGKVLGRLTDVLQAVINNNNSLVNGVERLNRFASDSYGKINNSLLVLDALSVCLFESKVIEEKRFQEVIEQLARQNEERMREQSKHECDAGCNGGCEHEAKGKEDSVGTQK